MNVIVLMNDTFRRDHVNAYSFPAPWQNPGGGSQFIHTPALDQLASESLLFDNFYAGSYPTIPTRYDLWTGCFGFPHRPWAPLSPDDRSLAEILADHGHTSMLIHDTPGMTNAGYNYQRGFTGWDRVRGQHQDSWRTDPGPYREFAAPYKLKSADAIQLYLRNIKDRQFEDEWMAGKTVKTAMEWLDRNHARKGFYLYVDMWDPHEPFDAPATDMARYADPDYSGDWIIYPAYGRPTYMSDPERDHVRASYAALCTYSDRWVGHLLEKLDALGIADDTMIVWMTDHGHGFGDHDLQGKPGGQLGTLYESNVRCPLLIRLPGGASGGRRTSAICQHVDIFATILDVFGHEIPGDVDARSLLPVIQGHTDQLRDYAISGRFGRGLDVSENVTWTDYGADHDGWVGPDTLPEPISISDFRWQLILSAEGHVSELYDIHADPAQFDNVLDDNPADAARLHSQIISFFEERDVASARIAPFRAAPTTRPNVEPPAFFGTSVPLFAFTDPNGKVLAFPDETEARELASACPGAPTVHATTLAGLATDGRNAHIAAFGQYHWPEDLLPRSG